MSDDTTQVEEQNTAPVEDADVAPATVESTDSIPVTNPPVVSQEGAQVDEESEAREVEPQVYEGTVKTQVSPPREPDADHAIVHETSVQLDEVVLDPSAPEAVQVPEAGRGSLALPIHDLAKPRPENVFAEEAAEADESSNDE